MKRIDLEGKSKLLCLKTKRCLRSLFCGFTSKLPVIIVIFCIIVNCWLLLPSMFNRVPVLSYFTHKFQLPMSYVMQGSIYIVDCEGNTYNNDVTIHVGGYCKRIGSNIDYDLEFSSPNNESLYIVIAYKNERGIESTYTQEVSFPNEGNVIQESFIVYD